MERGAFQPIFFDPIHRLLEDVGSIMVEAEYEAAIHLDSMIVNGSVFFGVDTFLGDFFLAAGFSERGKSSFFLSFGNTVR